MRNEMLHISEQKFAIMRGGKIVSDVIDVGFSPRVGWNNNWQ